MPQVCCNVGQMIKQLAFEEMSIFTSHACV